MEAFADTKAENQGGQTDKADAVYNYDLISIAESFLDESKL